MGNNIENKNKQLVEQRIGDVQIREELFSENQLQTYRKVMQIVDKNPMLEWKRDDPYHNKDFCLIEGKIEPVKNFCLKVQYVASLSMANTDTKVFGEGTETKVIAKVRVWGRDEERYVELEGASDVKETGASRNKPNKRAFHDAVARAQTRAFKSSLEAYMGFPFINLAIQELFGGFEVTRTPEDEGVTRDVTGPPQQKDQGEVELKRMVNSIWVRVKDAHKQGLITDDEKEEWRDVLKNNKYSMDYLSNVKVQVNKQIDLRKKEGSNV